MTAISWYGLEYQETDKRASGYWQRNVKWSKVLAEHVTVITGFVGSDFTLMHNNVRAHITKIV